MSTQVPGPRPLPILGNILGVMRRGGPDPYQEYLRQKFGGIAKARLVGEDLYFITDPDITR